MDLEFHQIALKYAHLRVIDDTRQTHLMASLARYEQQETVLVVPHAVDEDHYVLIDGYKRVAALAKLSRDTVRATVLEMSEVAALVMTHVLRRSPQRSALEEGWLLHELAERHGMSQRDLALRLQRSTSWVSRRLALVKVVPESVEAAIRRGEVSAQVATRYLVPLARSNADDSEALMGGLGGEHVSVRAMGHLYEAYMQGDEEQRARIVSCPGLFLRARTELERPVPEVSNDAWHQVVRRDLEMATSICQRAHRCLSQHESAGEGKEINATWKHLRRIVVSVGELLTAASKRHA
ncbi:MAG: ParB N-terminal domain-containing protein [Anaerosomatales bacterium]|nr:ParB N-terminal domain-containing protein [Anaerosomatales bacterium]